MSVFGRFSSGSLSSSSSSSSSASSNWDPFVSWKFYQEWLRPVSRRSVFGLLCISTSFQVLRAPESWSNYFFSAVFNLFLVHFQPFSVISWLIFSNFICFTMFQLIIKVLICNLRAWIKIISFHFNI